MLCAALLTGFYAQPLCAQQAPQVRVAAQQAQTQPFGLPTRDRDADTAGPPTTAAGTSDLRGTTSLEPTGQFPDNQLTDFNRSSISEADDTQPEAPAAADDTLGSLDPDQRSQRDSDVFARPFAGHDPDAFQIESLNPVRDRRTRAFFEDETDPFAHVGWRLGSFILFQQLEVSPAWDSNVFFEDNARSDWRADITSETRFVSNWSNHALEFRMLQARSHYRHFTAENDEGQTYELRGRLDVTSRTTAEGLASREIAQESRNSIDISGNTLTARPDVITDRLTGALNHRFNRLSLQLRGGHQNNSFETATAASDSDRDLRTRNVAFRAQWEFRPTLSVFGEVEHNNRDYKAVTITDGLSRSSTGERYRTGIALGQTGEILRGEASIGYGLQRPDAADLPDITAFLVDANVAWRITPLTSLLVDAATTIDETTLADSSGAVTRRMGARVRHAITERLFGETGVSYTTQNYQGSDLQERNTTLDINVEYKLNRHAALFSSYTHSRFRSSVESRDYNADTILFGARLRN